MSISRCSAGCWRYWKICVIRDIPLGIVTSRDWQEYRAYFSSPSFDALFTCIICKEDTLLHKPDPEPLLAYMRKMNAVKEDCIYIGDMDTDMECAARAGVSSALAVVECRWSGIAGLSFFTSNRYLHLYKT
ncbi:MAG: HAD family hydrolase [[Clostridium] innocuum]